jgi:hypothetical protein
MSVEYELKYITYAFQSNFYFCCFFPFYCISDTLSPCQKIANFFVLFAITKNNSG